MNATRKKLHAAIGGLWHETHAFAAGKTSLSDFEIFEGQKIIQSFAGTRTPIGGFLDACREIPEIEAIPACFASAVPSTTVSRDAYETLAEKLVDALRKISPDFVLLDLHGAMVASGCPDVESDLVARIKTLALSLPVGAVLDFHANISARFGCPRSATPPLTNVSGLRFMTAACAQFRRHLVRLRGAHGR